MSFVVNLITLPLYNNANLIQEEERKKIKSLEKVVNHIKNNFSGDKRFLMIQAYYKEQNYKPIYAIRSSISLLLQIPFFTSAYIFFTELKDLNHATIGVFPFINNLMQSDKILSFGSLSINLLPIIMTIINLVSASIYTKNFDIKGKIQPIVLALVFLVLLYDSPSALVLYWIFNNLFSLLKIVFYKTNINENKKILYNVNDNKNDFSILLCVMILFFVLGLLIPTYVLSANPNDFYLYEQTPVDLMLYTINIFLGYFVWCVLYYIILKNNAKSLFSIIIISATFYVIFNHFCFGNNFGVLTQFLVFDGGYPGFNSKDVILDFIVMFFIIVLAIILYNKKKKILLPLISVIFITVTIFIFKNMFIMFDKINDNNNYVDVNDTISDNIFTLSKKGKNVIVIMLDRSIGSYFEYVLAEKPEIKDKLDGFVFYPNTISSGPDITIVGAPALYGGYDYTTGSINKRKDIDLATKHNEALSIMPYNFSKNDYNVFVSNLPYENYNDNSKTPLFNTLNNTKKINLFSKNVSYDNDNKEVSCKIQKRNFILFSIMKVCPIKFKGLIYFNGNYLNTEICNYSMDFLKLYDALHSLKNHVNIDENDSNNFLLYCNEITHNNGTLLPYKKYVPIMNAENDAFTYSNIYGKNGQIFNGSKNHLSTEICAYVELCNFFDYIKGNNMYDNTRIIIASDHGRDYGTKMDKENTFKQIVKNEENIFCINSVNPTLLYKDFNSRGELKFDNTFMTNADVPILAMNDLFLSINPYLKSKIEIKKEDEKTPMFIIKGTHGWECENYRKKFQFADLLAVFNGNNIYDENGYDLDVDKYKDYDEYGKE